MAGFVHSVFLYHYEHGHGGAICMKLTIPVTFPLLLHVYSECHTLLPSISLSHPYGFKQIHQIAFSLLGVRAKHKVKS